ncbi:retrovirus-related pol polyprotein from transposon TNT 1-94 [Tanacetum coccineum]
MAKQYTQPKRPRNFAWFKEKLMLVEAQEACQILDEEQLEFILDPGIAKVQVAQQTIPQISAFQTEDLDAYDSNCDDISSAKVVLMANLSSCDSDVLSKVPYSDTYLNDMINQDVQEMSHSEQTYIDDFPDNEITSDSNIIPYSQYLQESQDAGIQDTNSSAPNDLLVLSLVEQMTDHVANLDKENQTNKMILKWMTAAFQQEIETLKETLNNNVKEKESLSTTLNVFKTESKEKEPKDIHKEIVLEKQNKELENIIVNIATSDSGSKPSGNTKKNRISRPSRSNQKNKVEEHHRKVKSSLNKTNSVSEPISNAHVKHSVRNAKFESICDICNNCLFDANHDMRVIDYVNDVNVHFKSKSKRKKREKYGNIRARCSMKLDIVGNLQVVQIVLCKFLGTVRFGNDHISKIMGYGDYQMGNVTISRVYYVEGLGHNLFSVGQFCDFYLEVAFRKHTYFIRDLEGVDLLKGSRCSNLYTLSMEDLLLSSPICLLSKASKTKSWLWHMRLSHLNFDYITSLAKQGLI